MIRPDIKTNKTPRYIQLYKKLRDDIVNFRYIYGAKLPSKRVISENEGVSIITVEHAYGLLCDEGYAEARERSGYFVCYKQGDTYGAVMQTRTDLTPKAKGADELFPISVYAKTVRKILSDQSEAITEKSPNSGCETLKRAIVDYLARSRGIFISDKQLIIGSGAEYLYGIIAQILGRGRVFGVEEPSYKQIRLAYEANGIKCESLALGSGGILSCDLAKTAASVLHVTPYQSFPSGITATASKKSEYLDWVNGGDRYIIEDDFESEFTVSTKVEDTIFSLDSRDRVIYLNTFSKTIFPSVRIGYMVLPTALLTAYEKTAGLYSCTVPTLDQYIIAELIHDGSFERHINSVRRKKRKQKNI